MIVWEEVVSEISELLSMLDGDEYPETYQYLSSVQVEIDPEYEEEEEEDVTVLRGDDEKQPDITLYEIAVGIMHCDLPKCFPDFVLDFVLYLLKQEIVEGKDDAMNELGSYYYNGDRGFEQDYKQAMDYYLMAAEKGNMTAHENLGYCYYYGRDGQPDYKKAFHHFALGAFCGNQVSLYKIADMYLNGLYVEKNEQEAFFLYMRCVMSIIDDSDTDRVAGPVYLRLGKMFEEGLGTDRNLKNALAAYQKAEIYLYEMVESGNTKYKNSLKNAIEGEKEVREMLLKDLKDKWEDDR